MRATFSPCCLSEECAGVMIKMDSDVAALLCLVLDPEKFAYLKEELSEEGLRTLAAFAPSFAEDVAESMVRRNASITRLGCEETKGAHTEEEMARLFAVAATSDSLFLLREFGAGISVPIPVPKNSSKMN